MKLVDKLLARDRLALARVISFIEDRDDSLREIVKQIYPKTGNAFVVGITGPPGAGKSTVTDKLVGEIRKTGKTAAVIAIDPSSPFSGGAILGDRIRMQSHIGDEGVYIRSLGTRGKHGGLSQSSKEVVMALDAAGFDWIIVETAGVGQTELDILKLAHMVCVVLVPESGDSIQVMKAGLMEIADLFVVNKSDRPEADKIVRELLAMIAMSEEMRGKHAGEAAQARSIPVVKTQALFDKGVDEFFLKIVEFSQFAADTGVLEKKREAFMVDELLDVIIEKLRKIGHNELETSAGRALLRQVLEKKQSPYDAAEELFESLLVVAKNK